MARPKTATARPAAMDWAAWWALGVYFATLALPFAMLLVVPGGRKPSSAIAWLLVIALLPWIGFLLFLLLGHPRLPRHRRRRLQEMQANLRASIQETLDDPDAPWVGPPLPEDHEGIATMVAHLGALVPFHGNGVELLDDYAGTLDRMIADIEAAKRFVHVQSYIFALDAATLPMIEAMQRAQARGVRVRVLLDHLGSRSFARHRLLLATLGRAGIAVEHMLPVEPWKGRFARPDLRNHRKILVVDGDVGFIGSLNLIEPHYRLGPRDPIRFEYVEIVARVRGPIVQQLDAVFRADWYAETGAQLLDAPVAQEQAGESLAQVLPSGPGHAPESNLRVFNALLHQATRRIDIVTAYFVPDETLMMALTTAAQRGVQVTMVLPERGNQFILRLAQASYYEELLEAGVRIFLHPRPWNLHAKTLAIDDEVCVIGSSNLDNRSFHLNLEVSLICYDAQVVDALRRIEDSYLAQARQLTLTAWKATSPIERAIQNIARLTSALQ